ncbi:hypothetical protein NDU88_002792 [Pleurodeles waltl]|uniref:Uncharacterized protein n=1 Tax=Pleurodeles waltl TaxID=8319 RepID=A0AAV7WRQ0_PLEWA|nr:hypothetical protein NDU88_002792 [Pleurodeles waltl]
MGRWVARHCRPLFRCLGCHLRLCRSNLIRFRKTWLRLPSKAFTAELRGGLPGCLFRASSLWIGARHVHRASGVDGSAFATTTRYVQFLWLYLKLHLDLDSKFRQQGYMNDHEGYRMKSFMLMLQAKLAMAV